MLTAVIFVPLAGVLVVALLPGGGERLARAVAVVVGAVPLVLLVVAWLVRFDTGETGFQLVESTSWIPTLGVGYTVGVDGVSLPLAAMSALLFPAAMAYPVDLRGRARQYF